MVGLEIVEHPMNGLIHHAVVQTGVLFDLVGLASGLLLLVQFVGPGGGRAEIVIEGLATP